LILFVYTIGVQVGPGFFASLRKKGLKLNLLAAAIVFSGMEYGHLGWELYRLTSPKLDRGPQQPNVPYDIRAMIQPGAPVTLDVGKLVEEEPKRQPGVDTTLSTYKLQFLGEQTYTHRRRPPTEYPS
jgi:hypothetical protein